ncbi:MAG TPA: IPT/TIG domain-containing protein [Thermoanaerobaculia bacterium]|jgi:RHS repeat-associated protein|nr:IPT/TIG domain-containing protein [Thermoanaerobaculia bacterium]
MRSSALRLLFVCLVVAVTFGAAAQSSDPFALTPPLVSQAITSCGDMTVSGGLIDSSATAGRGNLLSNGNIKVTGGKVDGDATAGPGKTVTRSGSGTITGMISSATTAFPCAIIDLGPLSATLASANDNASIPLSTQHKNPVSSADDFTLSGGDSITLQAGTYYFHKFTMSGGSTIALAGPVRILTTSDVNVSGGSIAGANQWQLHFWASSTKFVVSSSTFVGFIYAPSATLTVSAGTVVGGVYGGAVTVSGNSHVTRTIDNTPPMVTIISPLDHQAVIDLSQVVVHGTVTDSETAITSFQVNGSDVSLAADGSFDITLNLSTATPPTITATATNAAGLSATSAVTVQSALSQLAVAPPSLSVDQNATGQLSAIGTYADGSTADVTASATWVSSAPSIATVNGGVVTGVSPGTTTITATLGSLAASATVTVNPLLQSIAVAPSTATVVIGAKQAFTATGTYTDGSTRNLTNSVTWTSSDTGLASIDASGLATGLSAGMVTIRGSLESVSGSATLTILATPTIVSVQPTRGRTSGGDTVTITGTNFGATNTTSVTFGGFTAIVNGANATTITVTTPSHAAGTVDVTVTAPTGIITKTAAFTYLAPPTITSVAPNRGKTSGGDSITVTGSNFDTGGTTTLKIGAMPATNVVVTSPTSLTATTPAGTAGTTSVTVTTAGGSGSLNSAFTYIPPPSITSFTPAQGPVGTSVTINGTNFDAVAANDVVVIGGVPAVVTSATTTRLIATVASTAVTGPVSVTTIGGTATSTTNFTVLIYRSLQFTSSATTIQNGGHLQWAASITKFDNTSFDVTSSAVWTSSDSTVATVSSTGIVTAVSAGATDITVAFSGLTATVHLAITTPVSLPPATIQGPPLDPTIVTPIADSIRFLYSGPNAIQTGVATNAIADNRAAVVSGRVLDVSGAPLSGVIVTTAQHPEFGQTVTRADGRYDFVWNGGGPLYLVFTKAGYISSDRMVTTRWNQQKPVDDVVLVAYDGAVTTITAGAASIQVAQGSLVTDTDGTRRATILFPAGTSATLTNADGTTAPASTLHVRATEFTVGTNGPKAMPALLPSNSGYTYCVELSVDEAPGVTFSNPLPVYVENFINFPVGTPVPLGYFDRNQQKWLPAANGVVIKILTVANGTVTIDSDGDGVADNAPGLASDELAQLATLYTAGQTLWRVQVNHFTPFDENWPVATPIDAISPNLPQPDAQPTVFAGHQACGSIIDCENQRLGESIPITGTPYSLNYNSGRTDRVQYRMNVPVTGASVPASLQSITVQISIAGRTFTQQVALVPNQTLNFTWDGNDAYGRPVEGARIADVSVTYTYPARYRTPQTTVPAFDMPSPGTDVIGDRTRATISLQQGAGITLGRVSAVGAGLGGWTFSAQRAYDTIGRALYEGTVQRGSDGARNGEASIYRAAGSGAFARTLVTGTATQVGLSFPTSLAPMPDGGFYFVDNGWSTICYVDASGQLSLVGGSLSGQAGFTQDGAPAAGSLMNPFMMAVAPDGTVYFSDEQSGVSDRLRKIVNGVLQTVAGGTASAAPLGDGGPLAAANLGTICGLAFAPDGVLYISDCGHNRVRRVSLNGIITTIAGGGTSSSDNIPALQASIGPRNLTVGPDGSVYVAEDLTIVRITPDGFIHNLADRNGPAMVDGQPAAGHSTSHSIWGLAVAGDGTVIFSERSGLGDRVWTITGGIAHVLAGSDTGDRKLTLSGSLARAGQLGYLYDVALAPDGSVLIADSDQEVIEKTAPTFPALASSAATIIPSVDGTIGYVFENAHHTRTASTITGTTLQNLAYDANGYLASVTDVDGQTTTIERDSSENVTAIVAPAGQRTTLSIGAKGLLSVTNPATEAYQFDYNNLGLLSQMTDPRGGIHRFTYDDSGRLIKDADPSGGYLALTRAGSATAFAVQRQTAEGRGSTVQWQQNSDLVTARPYIGTDGLVVSAVENGDGSQSLTSPTGTIFTSSITADSRFGMSSPFISAGTIQLPSSLRATVSATRQVTLGDPNNPLSVTAYAETRSLNGRTFRLNYSKSSRSVTVTSPVGRVATTVLDANDRPSSIQIPGTAPLSITYESHGLPSVLALGARQTTLAYDDHARLKTLTDPVHRSVTFDYDAADRITFETFGDGRQIAFSYDGDGNVISVSPPTRHAHAFTYSPMDLVTGYVPPDLPNVPVSTTTYGYNHDHQLVSVIRPDGTPIGIGYDAAGRVATVTEPAGTHQYAYDPSRGTLMTVTAPNGNGLTFTYDGDLLKSATWSGSAAASVAFAYDANFRPISELVNGANSISFGYDNDDLLTTAGALTLQRDPTTGFLTGTTLANITDAYTYNTFGETLSYGVKLSGSSIFSLSYTRDDVGRVVQKTETVSGQTTTTIYGYDSAGHLSDVTVGASTRHYDFDANGNRTAVSIDGTAVGAATYDAQDRLTTYNGASFLYSDAGELQKKMDGAGTTSYIYDVLGNLRQVTLPDGTVIDYVVDAMNRRIGKKVNGTTVAGWIYSDQLRIVAETDGSGTVTKRFVYGDRPNVPEYMVWQGATYRIIADNVGSPRYVVQATAGTLAETITYDEFGNVTADSRPGFIPFGFAGGLYDGDTKLVRFGARDYDPAVGRWTSKDPTGFDGLDSNLFAYAGSDPINFIDPTGLDATTADPHVQEMMLDLWKKANYGMSPKEQAGWLIKDPKTGQYSCQGWPQTGQSNQLTLKKGWTKPANTVAVIHTHPAVGGRTQQPDDAGDRAVARATGVPIYTITKQNGVGKFDPATGQGSKEEPSIKFPNAAKDACSCQ